MSGNCQGILFPPECGNPVSLVTAKLISAFVFAVGILQSLYYLHPKFQASSHLLWLYSPVCVGPGRKPRRPVFSQRGSNKKSNQEDDLYESIDR